MQYKPVGNKQWLRSTGLTLFMDEVGSVLWGLCPNVWD